MTTNSHPNNNFYIGPSSIHGNGVFARKTLQPGQKIEVGIDFDSVFHLIPYVTKYFGAWINHDWNPNSHLEYHNYKWYIVASTTIPANQEITMDYRNSPWYILPPDPSWNRN